MHRSARKRILFTAAISAAAVLFLAAPSPTSAQTVDVDLRGGFYLDSDAVAFGGGILTPLSSSHHWYFNPNAEFGFSDGGDIFTINGDFHYDFHTDSSLAVWLGAGPALLIQDRGPAGDDIDAGANVFAGIGGKNGAVRPFGQVKGIISDNSQVALIGGVRF